MTASVRIVRALRTRVVVGAIMMTNCAPATALVALLLLLDSPDRVAHAQSGESSVNCPDPGSCYNTIGGGASNTISRGNYSVIGGGQNNLVDGGDYCVIAGGKDTRAATSTCSSSGGGWRDAPHARG